MKHQSLHGVLLHSLTVKNSDKILTFLSQEQGVISVYARSTQKPQSKIGPMLRTGAVLKIEITQGKGSLSTISQASSVFLPELENYESLQLLQQSLELTKRWCQEELPAPQVFSLLTHYLPEFCHSTKQSLLHKAFQVKLLTHLGFLGSVKTCASCNEPIEPEKHFLHYEQGIYCNNCTSGMETFISFSALKTILFLQTQHFSEIKKLTLSSEVMRELEEVIHTWVSAHLSKPLKSSI